MECKKLCYEACGPIAMSPLEASRIRSATGLVAVTSDLGWSGFSPSPLDRVPRCPVLDRKTNLFRPYGVPPLICRIYGVVAKLRCEHGCAPERWLTDEQVCEILSRIYDLKE